MTEAEEKSREKRLACSTPTPFNQKQVLCPVIPRVVHVQLALHAERTPRRLLCHPNRIALPNANAGVCTYCVHSSFCALLTTAERAVGHCQVCARRERSLMRRWKPGIPSESIKQRDTRNRCCRRPAEGQGLQRQPAANRKQGRKFLGCLSRGKGHAQFHTSINLPVDLPSISFLRYQSFPVFVSAFDDVHGKILKLKMTTNVTLCVSVRPSSPDYQLHGTRG